jgi:metal-responsive CopG/Arc/MetJ family transcriptional regulator
MKRTQVMLTDQLLKELDKLIARTELSRSDLIRRAIEEYLSKHKDSKK